MSIVLSLFMAILMTCAYALGSTFRTSIVIAIVVSNRLSFLSHVDLVLIALCF